MQRGISPTKHCSEPAADAGRRRGAGGDADGGGGAAVGGGSNAHPGSHGECTLDYREDGLIQSASTVEVLCRRQGELTAAEASQQNAPNRSAVLQPAAATALLRLLTRLLREDPASIV